MSKKYNIAVVGATGNVGSGVIAVLNDLKFPIDNLFALASSASLGKEVSFGKTVLKVQDVNLFDFNNADIAIFAINASLSKELYEKIKKTKCIMIDKSSAFRLDSKFPLVLSGVNSHEVSRYKESRLISGPNCIVSQIAYAISKIQEKYKIDRMVVSTYQSVSGAGKDAMNEFYDSTKRYFEIASGQLGTPLKPKQFEKEIAFNCIPKIDEFLDNGFTKEEEKIEQEIKKIFNDNSIKVNATCVRVPVFIGHSASVNIETKLPFDIEEIIHEISEIDDIIVMSDGYTTPKEISRTFGVYVSRIRRDETKPNALNMWIVADNVYGIGASYNAVKIAQDLIKIIN